MIRNQQNMGSHKGLSDLTVLKNGVVWFLEIKTADGKLSKYQILFMNNIIESGGNYMVIRSIDDSEFKKIFEGGRRKDESAISGNRIE